MFEVRGGVSIGWMGASGPLVCLKADAQALTLDVLLIGTYGFRKDQVVGLREHRGFLRLRGGVRIEHVIPHYPRRIIFWSTDSRALIDQIHALGFVPEAPAPTTPDRRGVPFRWWTVLAAGLYWNLLLLFGQYQHGFRFQRDEPPGIEVLAAVGGFFLGSAALRWIPTLRPLLLKKGRGYDEVKHGVHLMTIVCGAGFLLSLLLRLLPRAH
jgi:hypothetical protein